MKPPIDPIQAAREAGFDLNLVEANLRLTVEERLRLHDQALQVMLELQKARDAKLHPTAATTR